MSQADIVVFRRWQNGDVIALFPELPADLYGEYCDAYEHVGQHGGADYFGVIQKTTSCSVERCCGPRYRVDQNWLSTASDSASQSSPSRRTPSTCGGPSQHDISHQPNGEDRPEPPPNPSSIPEFCSPRQEPGKRREERPDAIRVTQAARQRRLGLICEEDRMLNEQALIDGSRLLSAYRLRMQPRYGVSRKLLVRMVGVNRQPVFCSGEY